MHNMPLLHYLRIHVAYNPFDSSRELRKVLWAYIMVTAYGIRTCCHLLDDLFLLKCSRFVGIFSNRKWLTTSTAL